MAYGSPKTLDDVAAYFAHIRGGRTPPAEQIEELRERYRRIGGTSPLRAITALQAEALQRDLARRGVSIPVSMAMKHAPPFIADVIEVMAADGIREVVALALAPHYSRLSVASYFSVAREAAATHGMILRAIESWHDHPGFIAALAARLRRALARCSSPDEAAVVFTAHSLPERIRAWDDPYPEQLLRTCELVASAVALRSWRFAYQSASQTGEPWLGPDVPEVLRELAAEGRRQVVLCPVGFVADHLEVLYDLDVEAREVAASLQVHLERAPSLNAEPDFIAALADLVTRALRAEGDP